MKRIFCCIVMIAVFLTAFSTVCFAEELDPTVENAPETQIQAQEDDEKNFADEIIAAVTNAENWGKLGVYFLGIIALIAAIYKKISPLLPFLAHIKDEGATKEDIEKKLNSAKDDILAEVRKYMDDVSGQIRDVKGEEDTTLTIITILANALKINPTAKTEIANYLTGINKPDGTIQEVVAAVGEKIQKALDAEEKIDTPALDAIAAETEEKEAHITLG